MSQLPPEYLDSKTPPDVIVTDTLRPPDTGPDAGRAAPQWKLEYQRIARGLSHVHTRRAYDAAQNIYR